MIFLTEHIEFLLIDNDCVVVPGWGAFIAQHTPCAYSEDDCYFSNPQRNIVFNASINHNDGLLANSIAKRKNIPFSNAVKEIEQHVAICWQQLADDNEIHFGKLGYFTATSAGDAEFTPGNCCFKHDSYFGLQGFSLPTLQQLNQQQETLNNDKPHNTNLKRISWRITQIAASIVVLLGLSFVLTTPIVYNDAVSSLATLNIPEVKKPEAKPNSTPATATQPAAAAKAQPPKKATPASEKQEMKGKYVLVICTLRSEKQVQQFFRWHTDIDASNVVKQGKNYLIYFDRSDNYGQLYKQSKNMPSRYEQCYIATC